MGLSSKTAAHVILMTKNRFTDTSNSFTDLTETKAPIMTNPRLNTPSYAPIADARVAHADSLVAKAGVLEMLHDWRTTDAVAHNRQHAPVLVSDRAIVVGMLLLAGDHVSPTIGALSRLFHEGLNAESQLLLGLDATFSITGDAAADSYLLRHTATRNAYGRFHATMSSHQKRHGRGVSRSHLTAELDADEVQREQTMRARLDNFTRAFLQMTLTQLPEQVSKVTDQVDIALADTFIRAPKPKKPTQQDNSEVAGATGADVLRAGSADGPSSWQYVGKLSRGKETAGRQLLAPYGRQNLGWGWEAVIAVRVDAKHADKKRFPRLVMAVHLATPGCDRAASAAYVLDDVIRSGLKAGVVDADRGYFARPTAPLHGAVTNLGFTPVFPYSRNQLGIQDRDTKAILVEGTLYCPCMPDAMANATADFLDE